MKLWYSKTSPYVRKIWALLHYHKLIDDVELIFAESFNAQSAHNQISPLGRIPALEISEGKFLYDSRVIAEYIDSIGHEKSVFPKDKQAYFQALNEQAIADGIMENIVPVFSERALRKDKQFWAERHEQLIDRGQRTCRYLEENFEKTNRITIGAIAVASVVNWLELRGSVVDIDIVHLAPALTKWANKMNKDYEWFQKTYPTI